MSKSTINYIEYLSKEKLNKNYPKTPCLKNNCNKDEKIPFNNSKSRTGSMIKKNKTGNSNSKKKIKINSNLILDQDPDNYKNNNNIHKNFGSKNILNINNACNNEYNNKNSYYNNISGYNFYNKKINYILNYDNCTKSNNAKSITDSNNFNLSNKNQSLIHNNSGGIYNTSSNNVITTKNTKKISTKKSNDYYNNSKRLSLPKNNNKKIEDKRNINKGKPISLLETSKSQKSKNISSNNMINNTNYNNNTYAHPIKSNLHINKTQFNNYNNYNFLNSNHFLKTNILSNINYNNDILNIYNNLVKSKNEVSPMSMKYQIPIKNKKKQKNCKSIIKSQSQSHFNYKISKDLSTKIKAKNSNSKSIKKNRSKINSKINNINNSNVFMSGSNIRKDYKRNIIKNTNLNLNNINNYNKFYYNNFIKASSQQKNLIKNLKYPPEESKTMLYYNNTYYNKYNNYYNKIHDNNFSFDNIPEEYNKDPLFKEIKTKWEELGGVYPEYKNKFINYTQKYENKNEIFNNEINELNLIKNNLNKLNNDIKKRNEIINQIKNINKNIHKNKYEEIKNILLSLRIITIDIINDYILFLKDISYDVFMNKFDINKIKNFNKNYLNEIKDDTNFLKDNIYLNKIFNFGINDPFLINPSLTKETNKNNDLSLPLDKDIFQKIYKCQYFLLKEKIFESIGQANTNLFLVNSIKSNKNNNNDDNINNYINSYRHSNNNNINNNDKNIFNLSNNKSDFSNIKKSSNYKSYKCNDFYFINNKSNKKNEEENSKKNDNNIISQDGKKSLIINQAKTNNNNTIENLSKIIKKDDSYTEQEPEQEQEEAIIRNSNDFNANNNLQIYPYDNNKDGPLSSLYSKYLSSVNENIKQSFNINNDIFSYSNIGLYPKILLFKDNNYNIKGMCTLSFNQNLNLTRKILLITSISCVGGYKISQILINLIEFCKNKEIIFDSMEINLYYIKKEDGKFILDEELEKEIKSEAKFKWVRLENDGEKRKIKYHYMPNNIITNKENSILNNINNNYCDPNLNKYAVYLNNHVLIKYLQEAGINNISMEEHSKLFFIIKLLKKYYLLDNNKDEQDVKIILENLKGIKLKKILRILSDYNNILETNVNDFKKDYCSNDNYNMELLYTFLEIIEKNKNNNNSINNKNLLCLNFCNIFTNFSNIIKIKINDYEYNIISMNEYIIEVFNIQDEKKEDELDEGNLFNFNIYDNNIYSNNNTITNNENNNKNENDKEREVLYFTKSENENISFIFYEINNEQNINNENDIKLLINKVLKKILVKDSEEPIKSYKKICLPSFSYKKRNTEEENKTYNDDGKLKLIEYNVLDYSEKFDFCVENLSYNDIKFSFPLNKNINENDDIKIIKNNFVVAVINNDLILDYQLPSMNIYYINKDKWIKIKK